MRPLAGAASQLSGISRAKWIGTHRRLRSRSTRRIARASPVPVYAMHETRLGHGIVGGLLVDGRAHGAQAAALVRRVLDGEDPALIPVQTSHSRPAFDDRELRRFGIPQTADPLSLLFGAAMLIGKLTVGGFLLALIETLSAKMRIFRAPEFLGTAFLLSVLAVLINLLLETK